MLIYIFLLSFFLISFIIRNLKANFSYEGKVCSYGVLLLGCLLCIVLGGFRWFTGTDWDSYANYFSESVSFEDFRNGSFEIGWAILNFIIKSISNTYTVYLIFFHSLIIFINIKATLIYIEKFPFDISLFSLLYFASHRGDIFATRQMLACALLFLAFSYHIMNKKKKFYILIFFASTIHITSLIFLFVPLLIRVKLNGYVIFLIVIFTICSLSYASSVFHIIIQKILELLSSGRIRGKIISYMNNESSISLLYIIRYLIFVPFLTRFYNKGNSNYKSIFNIYFFGCILFIFTSGIMPVLQRFALYFTNFEALLLVIYFKNLKKNTYKYLFLLMVVGYAIFKYLYSFQGEYHHLYVPYYSIFSYQIRG